jgi:hypothetical protein
MTSENTNSVYVALIHHPVYNKNRQVVRTCLTPLDLHDISRACRTYGIRAFYFVNPMRSQRELAQMIFDHWSTGWGARYNPNRKEAISLIRIAADLEGVRRAIEQEWGRAPKTVATSARMEGPDLDYPEMRARIRQGRDPFLLLFGTGWGLVREDIDAADFRLHPIQGQGEFNHLSVRSAVSIILDRILCDR